MIWALGALGFGAVLGWVSAYLVHHGRPGWREAKAVLGVLFGAALQALFGWAGTIVYGLGVALGAVAYGVTLLIPPLRRTHLG